VRPALDRRWATVLQIVGGLGTHDELMAAGARYADLFTLQAGAYR